MEKTDRQRFDNALSKFLYATNGTASPTRSILNTYWSQLERFTWSDVGSAMAQAVKTSTGHVSPAHLANLCRPAPPDPFEVIESRSADLERRMADADRSMERAGQDRFGAIWHNEEFQAVRMVANMEYGRRIHQRLPGGVRIPTPDSHGYAGPFDYHQVAAAAPVYRGKDPNKSANAWEYFWTLLREEFEGYLAENG